MHWKLGPDGRGTIDIIWKCFLALAFCCWTSLHLNLPRPTDLVSTKYLRKVRWAVVAIIFPEIILGMSFWQRSEAKITRKKLWGSACSDWSLKHAFFINMGGFRVQNTHGLLALDRDTFIDLLKSGKTPPLTTGEDIEGLSRSNALGKFIAVLAGAWLLCTTVIRRSENFAISPLEVTSSIFVLCMLAVYVCWWEKPYDVQTGIRWDFEWNLKNQTDRDIHNEHFIDNRVADFGEGFDIDFIFKRLIGKFGLAFTLGNFFFGGLHLLVLPAQCHFPTAAEQWI